MLYIMSATLLLLLFFCFFFFSYGWCECGCAYVFYSYSYPKIYLYPITKIESCRQHVSPLFICSAYISFQTFFFRCCCYLFDRNNISGVFHLWEKSESLIEFMFFIIRSICFENVLKQIFKMQTSNNRTKNTPYKQIWIFAES